MSAPRPPETAQDAGRRLWKTVLGEYDLSGADLELLRQAVVIADELAILEKLIRASGPLIRDGNGNPRANPAAVQFRLHADSLGKLLAALQVVGERLDDPFDEHDQDRPQKRSGPRGYYRLRAVE